MSSESIIRQANPNSNNLELAKVGVAATPALTATNFSTNTYYASDSTTYAHNLGFTPVIQAFIVDIAGTNFIQMPYTDPEAGGTGGGIQITSYFVEVDKNNLYIHAQTVSYGPYFVANYNVASRTVKYYLFRDRTNQ